MIGSGTMTLLNRDLRDDVTHAGLPALVFDADGKRLYVAIEVAHLDAKVGGTVDYQIMKMDIADYLKQAGNTAGHRELRRLLRTLFKEDSDGAEYADEISSAAMAYYKFRIWGNYYTNSHMF
jgi:hypothetical protein